MSEKIDIHHNEKKFRENMNLLEQDAQVCPRNKELITKYIRASELGQTVKKSQSRQNLFNV